MEVLMMLNSFGKAQLNFDQKQHVIRLRKTIFDIHSSFLK